MSIGLHTPTQNKYRSRVYSPTMRELRTEIFITDVANVHCGDGKIGESRKAKVALLIYPPFKSV